MRRTSLLSASVLAIGAMLASGTHAARAQSFDATGVIVAGAGAISTTPGTTTIFADAPNVVINWSPNAASGSGPINFQPAGTTALFTNRDSTTFSILNRIVPSDPARPIVFNGKVVSQLQDLSTGAISRGGTLFFYSPGGILVSSTGVFDVGNLVLTSSDLNYDAVTGTFDSSGTYKFLPANSGSTVEVRSGAQITAGPLNAYVALIAPKVVNSGTIDVDGSAVLVAADASTITFHPNGLFDIQIDQGTSAAGEVVTNDGTITGAAAGINVSHRVYVVAVPKNDAITLAIKGGSKLGFDVAGAANVDGNAIVLSAGFDIKGGDMASVRAPGGGASPVTLAIGAIDATSQLTGMATGQASLQIQGGNAATFASNVNISGVADPLAASADGAFISVSGVGSTLDIAGDLTVRSLDGGLVSGSAVTDAGAARILVSDGRMTVQGNVTADASRLGYGGQTSQGGQAALVASGSAVVEVDKDLVLSGDGIGQFVDDTSTLGSFPGIGGDARLSLGGGALVTVKGNLAVHAAGSGGSVGASGYVGADGTGGSAVVEGVAGGGALTVSGALTVDASGTGADGNFCVSCVIEGGLGTGGTAGLSAVPGVTMTITGATLVNASGQGGSTSVTDGKNAGAGVGGTAFVRSTGGAITTLGTLSVVADGTGGTGALTSSAASGAPGAGGLGGIGQGGAATISVGDPVTLGGGASLTATSVLVSASGIGGNGGTGAAGSGGLASTSARNGAMSGGVLSISADGLGGAGYNSGDGGAGSGGTAQVIAYSALEGDSTVTFATGVVSARGDGGAGSAPSAAAGVGAADGGAGGSGTGGEVLALAEAGNGVLYFGEANLNASGGGGSGGDGAGASGIGGAGGAGGSGFGGSATFGVVSGLETGTVNTGTATFSDALVLADGNGGLGGAGGFGISPGAPGSGGDAAGGAATLVVQGGVVKLLAPALVQADALGGGGGGGLGTGGNATVGGGGGLLDLRGVRLVGGSRDGHADQKGTLKAEDVAFSAAATGGKGAVQGTSSILGHPLSFLLDGAAIKAKSLDFKASGTAAPGAAPSVIALLGGNTTLAGAFQFVTPGTLMASLGGSNLFSDTTLISASDWLAVPAPAGPSGTVHGTSSVTLLSDGDLFGYLSAQTGGSLLLTAPGLIRLDNLTANGSISASGGTSLQLGNISAGTDVSIGALGDASVGKVGAGGAAALTSGAALSAGAVTAGQSAALNGTGSVTLGGNVVAGDAVLLVSGGAITGKTLSAGIVTPSASAEATYNVTVFGKGAVNLGAIAAANDIKVFTPQDLTVGALAGRDIAVLGGGKQTIGSFAAKRRVLLADYAMVPLGGDPLGVYDLDPVFAATPIAAGGPITVLRGSSTGSLVAVSSTDISASTISAFGAIDLEAGGMLQTGALNALGAITASSAGIMDVGRAISGDLLTLNAAGAMTSGFLSGTNGVGVTGLASLATGPVRSSAGGIVLTAAGNLASGRVTAAKAVLLTSSGASVATGGPISAGADVTLSAKGNLTTTAVTAIGTVDAKGAAVSMGDVRGASVTTAAGTTLDIGRVSATAGAAKLTAAGNLASGAVSASGPVTLMSTAGNVAAGNLASATGTISFSAKQGAGAAGKVSAASGITMTAGTSLGLTSATSASGDVVLDAAGDLTSGDLAAAGGRLLVSAGGAAALGNLAASGLAGNVGLRVSTGTTLDLGNAATGAGELRLVSGGAMAAGDLTASAGVLTIQAGGALAAGKLSGRDEITLKAGGKADLAGDAVSAAGDVALSVAGSLTGQAVTASAGQIGVNAAGKIKLSGLTAATSLTVTSGDALVAGNLHGSVVTISAARSLQAGSIAATGGTATLTAAGDLTTGAASATGVFALTSSGGKVTVNGTIAGGADVKLTASGDVSASAVTAAGALDAKGAAVTLGDVRAASVGAAAGTALATGRVTATAGAAKLSAAGNLTSGAVTATDAVSLSSSAGSVTAGGAISAGKDVTLAASGDLTTAAITAGGALDAKGGAVVLGTSKAVRVNVLAGTTLATGRVTASGGSVSLASTGNLTSGAIAGAGAVSLSSSGGSVTGGTINAGGDLTLQAAGDLRAGALTAAGGLLAGGANVTLGNARAARVDLSSPGSVSLGTVDSAATDAFVSAGSALRSGAINAAGAIKLTSAAAMRTGDLTAGDQVLAAAGGSATFGAVRSKAATAELRANGGSLTVGSVTAATDTALVAANDLTVGAVKARDILLLAGGNVNAADLTSPGGRILIASNTLVTSGGTIGEYNFDAVFAAPLQSAGGTVAITGAVAGGAFTAAMDGAANLQGIDATRAILIDSGGTVNLGGIAKAPRIEIRASDLVMPAGSGLDAGRAGAITLVSRNREGLGIGDDLDSSVLSGDSYTLDNAEWARIKSGSLTVFGLDGAGPVDMLIGKLDVTGPDAGSTIDDPAGTVLFRTGSSAGAAPSGTIRVTGALNATGFGAGNALVFQTGQFQLASDTGSIAVLGKGGALAGAVQIAARDIHFAATPLLVQLAANPFFAGVETALDRVSAGGSQPVLRASTLDLAAGRTLYIQRSGAGINPLGFDVPLAGLKARGTGAGPVTVIINGTFRGAAGTIGGVDAWVLFTRSGPDLGGFSAQSRLNGCLLNPAFCGALSDPDPGLPTLIDVLEKPDDPTPDGPDAPRPPSSNAIMPPQTILAVQPDSLPGQIEEPIAGSGNPALTGSSIGQAGAPLQ